jgi:hypothetical protein
VNAQQPRMSARRLSSNVTSLVTEAQNEFAPASAQHLSQERQVTVPVMVSESTPTSHCASHGVRINTVTIAIQQGPLVREVSRQGITICSFPCLLLVGRISPTGGFSAARKIRRLVESEDWCQRSRSSEYLLNKTCRLLNNVGFS